MRNPELLAGCIKEVLALADVLDTSYARKNGCELIVSCGFRSPEKNQSVKGSPTSQHLLGRAVDFYFSDKYTIFKHVTPIYELFMADQGVWQGATQFEVCRGVKDGKWINHIHVGFKKDIPKTSFTGIYA